MMFALNYSYDRQHLAHSPAPIRRWAPLNAVLQSSNPIPSFYCVNSRFGLQSSQLPLIWNRGRLINKWRRTLMAVDQIIALLGMLAASLPTDEDRAFSIDVAHLILQAQQGDREAVATIYRIHVTMIYRYIAVRVPSSHDAEDLTAEVFVKMVEALPTYQITGAPFEAWLYRIAASRVSDFYRSKTHLQREELPEHLADDAASFEDALVDEQTVEALRRALRRLPEEHQTILILRFVERKSHEEVAMLLGKSVTAVKSIQHRALSQLTTLLGSNHKVRHYLRGRHE